MKSRYDSNVNCKPCDNPWYKGAEISRWLGSYVHQGCKDREAAAIQSAGRVTALPEHRGRADVAPKVGVKRIRQEGLGPITFWGGRT